MGILAATAAIGLMMASGPSVTEQRQVIDGWHPLVGPGFEVMLGTRFTTPPGAAARFLRLRLPAGATCWLNGARLSANREGDHDVSDWLAAKGENRLVLAGLDAGANPAVSLIITTRVYVAAHRLRRQPGGGVAAEILVRNTLENTVNAVVAVRGSGIDMETTATVPPGVSEWVRFGKPGPAAPAGARVDISVEKEEEAMEGGYTFISAAQLEP